MPSSPRIDESRLWAFLEEVSAHGGTPDGGLHRLAASAEDGAARDLVVARARGLGCELRVDAVGNVFLRRPGAPGRRRAVAMGSHLDSQPRAGRYDGTYGVAAGLEVLTALAEAEVATREPVELVVWTNEEGARFPPAMMGSAVFAGRLAAADALATVDADGVSLGEALASIGYAGSAEGGPDGLAAYLEAHIEQGPILETEGLDVGVVTGAQAQYWLEVEVTGERGHAGTFPMEARRDALVAAAEMVGAVRRIGLARPGVGRATVGRLEVPDAAPNVVPGLVRMTIELRHPEAAVLTEMLAQARTMVVDVARRHGVGCRAELALSSAPARFDDAVVAAVDAAAARLGLSHRRLVSGAGHDAVPLSSVVPTGMVFVPCRAGVSHAPTERMTPRWAADGARVLLETVLVLAG